MHIQTQEDFTTFADALLAAPNFRMPLGWGVFKPQRRRKKILTGTYVSLNWGSNLRSFAAFAYATGLLETPQAHRSEATVEITHASAQKLRALFQPFFTGRTSCEKPHQNAQLAYLLGRMIPTNTQDPPLLVALYEDVPPQSIASVYFKLTALSRRFVKPLQLNLQGIYDLLPNLAWSGQTAIELDYLRQNEMLLKLRGDYPVIDFVDKFPRILMHWVPDDDVRILSTHNVRLGAYLAPGTTVMPGASYINFNAGTLGKAMVEGRISSSSTVGEGCDIGGGASIIGTLSGGNTRPISIGRNCFLGANSVTGIPLGNNCIIDANIAVLSGTVFEVMKLEDIQSHNPDFKPASNTVKGEQLVGLHNLHFRQNSTTGTMLVKPSPRSIPLNAQLHG